MGHLRIAIIGGGASGIAMAVKLARAGFRDFVIFEAEADLGGTWFVNTFPGCEVDVESHAYSYSFQPYDWSRNFASGAEVEQYLVDVVEAFELKDHFRFNASVLSAEWIDPKQSYRITLHGGERAEFDVVVSCVGTLSNPYIPEWASESHFEGPIFHTARWENQHDLSGKTVALVGTGSTAAQVGPSLAPIVGKLLHFQRSPTWVFPKDAHDYSPSVRTKFARSTLRQRWDRFKIFRRSEARKLRRGMFLRGSKESIAFQETLEKYIRDQVNDPEVAQALIPDYPVGCKRPVQAVDVYQMYNRDNVTLVPHAVRALERDRVIDATGEAHQVDVVVLSTGFTAQRYLANLEVRGRGGQSLHEVWGLSPKAFLGLSVPGFPNFFMVWGPNCNGGVSAISQAEFAADAVVRRLRLMRSSGRRIVDTRRSAYEWFVAWVDSANGKRTSRAFGQCSNYYYAPDGRNVTQWPSTRRAYQLMTLVLPWWGWTFRSTVDQPPSTHVAGGGLEKLQDLPL